MESNCPAHTVEYRPCLLPGPACPFLENLVNVTRILDQLLPTLPHGSEKVPVGLPKAFLKITIANSPRLMVRNHLGVFLRGRKKLEEIEDAEDRRKLTDAANEWMWRAVRVDSD